jgi:DNA-binding NtrC family response regulator
MREVSDRLLRAAASNSTVLILGESGTGKELVAQAIHTHSARVDQPLVSVNVAALPEGLVESELFGHVAGSFTGATADRIGKFEAANSGTLFIDEIGDTELGAQVKLLRVLETRVITPVGSNDEQRVDVRVIAATSKDLARLVADGAFREDLYYRLNVVVLRLPPLRERHGDIATLTNHFLNLTSQTLGRSAPRLSPKLVERLELLEWPGNVRQLKNAIESMVVLSEGDELTISDLPADLQSSPHATRNPSDVGTSGDLEVLERRAILDALERSLGNRTHAASLLGISVRTLQRKLKAWGLAGET